MYTKNNRTLSLEDAQANASAVGMELNDWASSFGWSSEGKQNDLTETDPPANQNTETSVGESNSGDISLGSPEVDLVQKSKEAIKNIKLTADEIQSIEAEAAEELRIQLAAENNMAINAVTDEQLSELLPSKITNLKAQALSNKIAPIMDDFEDDSLNFFEEGVKTLRLASVWASKYLPEGFSKTAARVGQAAFITDAEIEMQKGKKAIAEDFKKSQSEAVTAHNKAAEEVNNHAITIDAIDVELQDLESRYENDPYSVTPQEQIEYSELIETRNAAALALNNKLGSLDQYVEEATNASEIISMVNRAYKPSEIVLNRMEGATLRLVAGLGDVVRNVNPVKLTEVLTGGYKPMWAGVMDDGIKSWTNDLYSEVQNLEARTRKTQSFLTIGENGDVAGDLFDFTLDLFSEQVVNTAVTASLPGAGLYIVSAGAAGNKFHEMDLQIEEGKNISAAQYYGAAFMHGAGEFVTEKVTLGQARGAFSATRKMFDLQAASGLTNIVPTVTKAFGTYGFNLLSEAGAEGGSQIIGNIADKYILKENISLYDGVAEAAISGAFMSGTAFSAPVLAVDLTRAFTYGPEIKAANMRSREMMDLKIKFDKLPVSEDPEVMQAKAAILERIDELAEENVQAINVAAARVDELSRADKRSLLDIDTKAQRFRGKIDSINGNKKLSEDQKKKMVSRYANGLNLLENQKSQIFGNTEASLGRARAKAFQMITAAEAGVDFNYIEGETSAEAIAEAKKLVKDSNLSEEAKAKLNEKLEEASNEEGMNGFYLGAELGLPIALTTAEGKKRNSSVAAHEVSHATLFAKLLEGNADAVGLANDLASYLIKNHGELAARKLQGVINTYTKAKGFTDAQIAEEIMAAAVELTRRLDLDISKNQTLQGKLMSRWNKLFPNNKEITEVRTGKDVLDAIISFNSSFDKGEMSGLSKDIIEGKVKARQTTESAIKTARANIQYSKGQDISSAADRAKRVLEKVSSNMEFFDPNSPLIARVLPGMIQAQLAKLSIKGLQFDMDEANSDIIYRLYSNGDINKFDGRGTLYGYINGRISFRIKDMLKASGEGKNDIVEDFNQTDIEDLKGVAAEVTTIEQTEERVQDEKPEYRPLLNSRIAKPEVIENILAKIPRIVGTLKNRIDAPVSKNTTVTPLMNELRLALGKQVDIDLKKAMGGKKDGVLRRFLTDNKKAILENMTTTYLMSAFPAAIQKKVDGVFTSDWKGKKIDRETTNTDQAGRTSGAEIVRRLPNASTKIDDKTFLSFILDEKGNPLRGKKESLAKAIGEELAIEIINQEMQDPESQIRQAFEANQERLGAELADNFVAKLKLDSERGNVKYSISLDVLQDKDFQQGLRNLTRRIIKHGQIEIISDDFKILVKHDPRFTKEFGEALKIMLTEGTLDGGVGAGFISQIKSNENIPSDVADELSRVHFGSPIGKVSAAEFEKLGEPVVNDIIPLFPYRILQKLGPQIFGATARYTKTFRDKIEVSGASDNTVPKALNVSLTHKFNKPSTGIFKEVNTILESDLPATEKIRQFEESEARQKILQANKHNRLLAIYTAKKLASTVQKNSFLGWLNGGSNMGVNPSTILRMLQAQTNLKDGFRAYGNIEYITFKNGPQNNIKFEHVLDNATLMAELANIILTESNSDIADIKIENLFEGNNMWAEDNATLDFIDTAGQNNPQRDGRLLMLPKAQLDDVYYIGGSNVVKAEPIVRQKIEANKAKASLKIDYEALVRSKKSLKQSSLFSLSTPQAIFMVGGPGAGKSSVIAGLRLVEDGYRLINQDPYLEKYIKEAGLPTDEKTYDKEQRSLRAKLGWKARKAAEEDLASNTAAKESMVVDGTGASYKATTKKIKALEDAGYEVHMVFVNTSKEIAVQRNRARAERSLADFIVTKTWDNVQESVAKYREDYGDRFYGIEMDNLKFGEELPADFVKSVKNGLNKSKVQYSLSLSEELNNMVERTKGVAADKVYSAAQARMQGEKKGKYRLFLPATAEDFRGLTSYAFAGKGKQGEADQKFIEDKLITPYTRGVAMIEAIKQQVRREYNALAKANKQYFKMLGKKITNSDYTYDQALRVYMWTQQGIEIPGMSKDDINFLVNEIKQFPALIDLGSQMQLISRQDTWSEPGEHWLSRTLISDLNGMTERVGRKKYLQEFIENSAEIFSVENLNKIEAVYGTTHRKAIEDALYAMENGTNRGKGSDNAQVNAWLNWVNNSTGAIMFLNVRSAILQTLSATNFINWSDNNPLKVAAAFANQPQYWSDFAMIFNSDKLKQRRSGLQTDVNAAEIANEAEGAKNKAAAVVTYLLKIGFTPTQMADSFAISIGGASFYRNRVNTYLKEGMDQAAAEKQAFEDFSKTADEAQQSSDPYLVSQEQRSVLGRLVLAFQNTPMQYTRLMKKAMKDLANGRGDAKTHISKIIYYGAVQNFIFSALQTALFAVIPGFDDEDESEMTEKELEKLERKNDKRNLRIINSMTDSILKGSGARGAALATIKNTITEYFAQKEKGFMADRGAIILQALSLSPPIGSKLRKINSALAGEAFNKDVLEARGFSITEDGRLNLSPAYSIIGSAVEGITNVPLARMVDLINGYSEALDSRNTAWQRIALALGWKTWDVGAKNEEHDLIKTEGKARRKEEGKAKAKETRAKNKTNKIARKKEDWAEFSKGMSSMEKGKKYRSWSIAWDSKNKNK
jgi:chloramphenicol 3-O-phosphotransferase